MMMTKYTGNLIPFVESDPKNERKWGYLDEDTGEIVIKAKYAYVSPFVGNFAIVSKDRHGRQTIINKDEKIISTGQFNKAYFVVSESGKGTAVVLENEYTRTKFQIGLISGGNISTETGSYKEGYYKYRMINPVTGKTIIPKRENYLIYDIETVGDYFIVGTDLYLFLDNGDIECVSKDNAELTVRILRDYFVRRGINALVKDSYSNIEIDYTPYIREKYADPDLSGAFEKLPAEFDIPFEKYEPFYRDPSEYLNTSLEINERKYLLYFTDYETGKRAMGIFNESKAEWELGPRFFVRFNNNTTTLFYIVDITKTNNPHLYKIGLSNDDIGWARGRMAVISGGIYSTSEGDFMHNLYLYENYPPRAGIVLMPSGNSQRSVKFPGYGVYYRDYSRIAAQERSSSQEPENAQETILSHSCYVQTVGFSPDSRTVISGDRDGMVIFWDTESGDITRILPRIRTGWDAGINCIAISPDAKNIAFGSYDDTVKIWNAESEQITTLRGHTHWVISVAFSHDGKTIVSGQQYSMSNGGINIIFWDIESKEQIMTFSLQEDDVHKHIDAVAVSPDGKNIISGDSFGRIKIWDSTSGGQIRSSPRGEGSLRAVSPDGKYIVVSRLYSNNKTIALLDLESGEQIRIFNGHTAAVEPIVFSPDGKTIVSGDSDGMIIFWDTESGKQIRAFRGHAGTIYSIAFSPDGKNIVSGAGNRDAGEVKLWDAATGGLIRTFGQIP